VPLSSPELFASHHDVSEFSCGKPALDHWLQNRALSNQTKGFTAVMVVHEAGRVVGFYGLAPTPSLRQPCRAPFEPGSRQTLCLVYC